MASPIQTTDLDMEVTTTPSETGSVVSGVKRPASEPTPDSSSDTDVVEKKAKKTGTSHNWGALYFNNPNNEYTIEFNEKTKQYDFLTPNGRRFCFTTPATKALCRYLRPGGNLGKFQFSRTEESASINTMLVCGTHEKLAEIHKEFRTYIESLENALLESMWENPEIKQAMMKNANDIMNLPPGKTEEEKAAREENLTKVAHKLFLEGAQRCIKPGDTEGEYNINAKTRAFFETIKNSGEWTQQKVSYFDENYEKRDDDYELGSVAIISLVLRPTGFTTPGYSKYGMSLRMAWEVIVYKELGANATIADRSTLFDTTRPYNFVVKTAKSGQRKVYVKNQSGSDYTWITAPATVKYNVESSLGKFEGKIKESNSKYEGTVVLSEENLQFVQKVYNDACKWLAHEDSILKEEKEKLRKTAAVIEKDYEEVFRSKFQSPIRDDGSVKVSTKEFYENSVSGDFERQPFPIEDSDGNLTDDNKIASGAAAEIPLRFSVYTLSSGIFGMKLDINTKYPTRVTQEAGFVEGAPPPPTFDL